MPPNTNPAQGSGSPLLDALIEANTAVRAASERYHVPVAALNLLMGYQDEGDESDSFDSPDMVDCPECGQPMPEGGTCPGCGYDAPQQHDNPTSDAVHQNAPLGTLSVANLARKLTRRKKPGVQETGPKSTSEGTQDPNWVPGGGAHFAAQDGSDFRYVVPFAFGEWVNCLPLPHVAQHSVYGEVAMTRERIADMVAKFNQGVYQKQVPVDAEHETKTSGAFGWVTQLRQNADGSADALVDWTDRGLAMLQAKRFKYVSPEFFPEWTPPDGTDPISNVFVGLALVTKPFFKEGTLKPIMASESSLTINNETLPFASPKPTTRPEGQQETRMPENDGTQNQNPPAGGATTETGKAEAAAQSFADLEQKYAESQKTILQLSEQNQKLAERMDAADTANRLQAFKAEATEWYGDPTLHAEFMDSLPSDEKREFYRQQQRAAAEQIKMGHLFGSRGVDTGPGAGTALAEIEAKTKALQESDPKLSHAQAYTDVITKNPQLYDRAEAERIAAL